MSSPSDFDDLCEQAKRLIRHKDCTRAIQVFEQARRLNDSHVGVHEGLAAAYFLSKNYDKAVEHFTRITQLDPRRGDALINLGAVYNRMGEHEKAIGVLRRGIQKEVKSSEGFYNLGIAHRRLDQFTMAVSAYREALRLNPEMAEAHQNLANVYLHMGNNQQAIMHFHKALSLRPGFQRAQRGLAKAEGALLKAKAAISPFGRLVDEASIGVQAAPRVERELSERERFEDRQEVHKLAAEIETAALGFVAHIKQEFEPKLLALSRAVAQGMDAPAALLKTQSDFQTAVARCAELRQDFRRKVLELRDHEELVNTSEANPE